MLHPEIVHPGEVLFPEALRPEEVRITFEEGDYVFGIDGGENPLFLGPHAGPVRPGGSPNAGVEEGFPVRAVELLESFHVVLHVEEGSGATAVDDFVERVEFVVRVGERARERDVARGEAVVVGVCVLLPAGLFADVHPGYDRR